MSTQTVGVFINFQGRAREAMEFYHKALGGKLELYAMGDRGVPMPAKPGDRITWAQLVADGVAIYGSDGHPDYPATAGDNVAIALRLSDQERLEKVFESLAEGGKVKAPLTRYTWRAGSAGWLADKFGISWSIATGG